jgi:hypothetical protein
MFGKVIVLWNLFNWLVRLLPELERQLTATVEASEKSLRRCGWERPSIKIEC